MRNGIPSLDELLSDLSELSKLPDSAALSMPAGAYASDEMFELEVRRVFEREWVPLGRTEEVAEPGDYFTTELAGDAPLVVRGDDRRIQVFSNVCRHKWTEVAQGLRTGCFSGCQEKPLGSLNPSLIAPGEAW